MAPLIYIPGRQSRLKSILGKVLGKSLLDTEFGYGVWLMEQASDYVISDIIRACVVN